MEITFKGRQTDVAARFRDQATAKLEKLEKLDQKAIRVDVEVSVERNPRQSSQKERVELTIISRGPTIRAEAAAEDRFAALDLALAKLDSRLRRALDRRKRHHGSHGSGGGYGAGRVADRLSPEQLVVPEAAELPRQRAPGGEPAGGEPATGSAGLGSAESVVAISADGDGPLVVREKFHHGTPIAIDQALLEMELVGHDFYLFHDIDSGTPSVVYRRRGYQYGVIRLVEDQVPVQDDSGSRSGQLAGTNGEGPVRQRPETSSARSG